jgi:glutathione S-transferase
VDFITGTDFTDGAPHSGDRIHAPVRRAFRFFQRAFSMLALTKKNERRKRQGPKMKLVASLTSPYARKVRIVMAEKRIECEFVAENVWAADTKVGDFNPLGKVPVLVLDDELSVYDSRVIVEYLDGVTPVSRLIPEDGRARVLVKRWEALADGILDAGIAIFLERKRADAQQSPEWIARQRGKIDAAIAAASRELGERDWCHGVGLTLADIALGSALLWLEFRLPEIKWRAAHPNLQVHIERLEARPSFAETIPKA